MPVTTQITGTVVLPDGTAPQNGFIHFTPLAWDGPADGGVKAPAARTFPLGPAGGLVDVSLVPTTASMRQMPYRVEISHYNPATLAVERTDLGLISVPEVAEGGSVSIRALLSDPGVLPTAPDALAQVTAKAVEVDTDRAAAQSARVAAEAAAAIAQSGTDVSVEVFSELASRLRYSGATGAQLNVAAGMYIRDRSAGAIYRVLASGAAGADLDYTGSGGVKLDIAGRTFDVDAMPGASFSDRLSAAVAAAQRRGGGLVTMGPRKSVTLTRRVELPVGRIKYDLQGAVIDASSVPDADGYAMRLIPDALDTASNILPIGGFRLIGPTDPARNLDGVYIGRQSGATGGNTAWASIQYIRVDGFRDGLVFGPHAWLNSLEKFYFYGQRRRAVGFGTAAEGSFNAGEQMLLRHGVFDGVSNAAGDAVCVETALGYAGTITLENVSFDYSDTDVLCRAGMINIIAPHGENNAILPNIRRVFTDGQSHPPIINIIGGSLGHYWDRLAGDLEGDGGKAAYIDNAGSGLGGVFVTGTTFRMFDRSVTEIFRSNADVPVNFVNCNFEVQTNATPYLSKRLNVIQDPEFALDPFVWLAPMENYVPNGALDGPYTSGRPDGMTAAGGVAGVTQTVSVDMAAGYPRLKVVLSGTATATGTVGIYLLSPSTCASQQDNRWIGAAYVAFEASAGVDNVQVNMVDRLAGGSGNGNSVTTHAISRRRKRIEGGRTSAASTAYVQFGVQVAITNGAAVSATYYIDTPTLRPDHCVYADAIFDTAAGAVLATGRSRRLMTGGVGGSAALEISNSGTGVCGRYQEISIRDGQRLWVRGMIKGTITAGSYGLRAEWLDRDGAIIGTRDYGGLLTASEASFVQRGDVRFAPSGTDRARIWCYTSDINGSAVFDQVYAWII